jgi:hypothetical protein
MPSEATIRRRAKRLGYYVSRSRERKPSPHADNGDRYMLINPKRWVVLGRRFDASLQDIDEFLKRRAA